MYAQQQSAYHSRKDYYSEIIGDAAIHPVDKLLKPGKDIIHSSVYQCNTCLNNFTGKIEDVYNTQPLP